MDKYPMKKFLDNWATAHRDWQAAGTAIFLIGILSWGWYMTQDVSLDDILEVRYISANVIDISSGSGSTARPSLGMGIVELEDGQKVRILFSTPVPKLGDAVPLRVEYFKNGESFYSLDVERWRMGES